ncbi:hypothetical protein WN55_00002 [Dufourea novaeangliae]|nr:hypothetical protein WN55_00002 [Dufourea novaeangliae]
MDMCARVHLGFWADDLAREREPSKTAEAARRCARGQCSPLVLGYPWCLQGFSLRLRGRPECRPYVHT